MKSLKKLKSAFVILFVSLLNSCANIKISDSEWCGDLGAEGASCFHTLSDKQRNLNRPSWEEERVGMVCTSPKTFSDWQSTIMKLCIASKRCKFEKNKAVFKLIK